MQETKTNVMSESKTHIDKAVDILSRYFGDTTAEMYRVYYADKSSEQVLESLQSLLEEVVGPTMAPKIITDYKNSL